MHSLIEKSHSVFKSTRSQLCHISLQGMQAGWVVLHCMFLQVLQPAKVLGTVRTLTSGRKGWILTAVLLMCHPVFLLCEFAPTGKLAGNIIELWVMQFLVLGEPAFLPEHLVTTLFITSKHCSIRVMLPVPVPGALGCCYLQSTCHTQHNEKMSGSCAEP